MMQRRLIIYIVGMLAGCFSLCAQEVDTLRTIDGKDSLIREKVFVRDTIFLRLEPIGYEAENDSADMIHVKARGRFDRGIVNYRFIPKRKWIGGLTFSYSNFDSDDSRMLFSFLKDFDFNLRTFSVKPFIGYAVRDNITIGVKMGYNHTVGELGAISLNIDDDLDFSLKDLRYAEDLYTVAFFHRSYVGLDRGKRFGLFNETSVSYNNGTSSFSRGKDEEMKRTDTTVHELHLGINPGVSVFIMNNVCAELSFGVIGFKYRVENQRNSEGEIGKRRNSGADFKINLFNINIGITLCL